MKDNPRSSNFIATHVGIPPIRGGAVRASSLKYGRRLVAMFIAISYLIWAPQALLLTGGIVAISPIISLAETKSSETTIIPIADDLQGAWEPMSRNYLEFGQLTIKADNLSWGTCVETKFNVLYVEDDTYYIQLHRSPLCKLRGKSSFLIIESTTQGLEVAICKDRVEMKKPRNARLCSWGILTKRN